MRPLRPRNDRLRLLMLVLAMIVPAVALIGFSIAHLKSIQHDHALEAAIQRDFEQMLAISEKQMASRANDIVDAARNDFPSAADDPRAMLQEVLQHNPHLAHAFLYDHDRGGLTVVSRESRMREPDFRRESEKITAMLTAWLPIEGRELVEKLWKMGKQDGRPVMFDYNYAPRGDKRLYQTVALFPLRGLPHDRVTIGGIVLDAEYQRDRFFPDALNSMAECPTNSADKSELAGAIPAITLRAKHDTELLAASANYDGGKAEVERATDTLPGLILGIKYRGTTIAALSSHFLHTSYLVLGGLSLLMAGGVFLAWRNINREMKLAKLKSDFVSNVSHELRTPLSSIRLYAETLEMGRIANPEKYQEYYQTIRKESERLTALINNILDFSRIEAGRKEYNFRETDIAELVRSTVDSYRYQIERHGFVFEEHIEPDLPPVLVDREAIGRSVLNLVNNAVKYSGEQKYLGINVGRVDGSVQVEVVDHGIGIPRSEQHRIFEKFYRASDPLVHNTKGSGLGLSLVRHVVEAHGGQIMVESVPGAGSRFTILLPVEGKSKSATARTA